MLMHRLSPRREMHLEVCSTCRCATNVVSRRGTALMIVGQLSVQTDAETRAAPERCNMIV